MSSHVTETLLGTGTSATDLRTEVADLAVVVRELLHIVRPAEPEAWMRIPEIARRLGLTEGHVRDCCKRRIFQAVKRGGWLINWESARKSDLVSEWRP